VVHGVDCPAAHGYVSQAFIDGSVDLCNPTRSPWHSRRTDRMDLPALRDNGQRHARHTCGSNPAILEEGCQREDEGMRSRTNPRLPACPPPHPLDITFQNIKKTLTAPLNELHGAVYFFTAASDPLFEYSCLNHYNPRKSHTWT
jgi:hypothetical protein